MANKLELSVDVHWSKFDTLNIEGKELSSWKLLCFIEFETFNLENLWVYPDC